MNLSFREKSIWTSLIVTLLIFGYYYFQAFSIFSNAAIPNESLMGLFVGVVVLTIVVQVVLQSVLAIANRKEAASASDERDTLIELKATRLAYFILAGGVWIAGISIFVLPSALITANIILFFFILAEIIGFSTRLFFYRRGI